jgi:hypothetical protein
MKEQLMSIAITGLQVLSPVILALLGLFAKKLLQLIDARVRNETMRGILERLDQTALAVVSEVQQTVVDHLDAKAPKDSLLQARNAALLNLRALLGTKGLDEMKRILGLSEQDVEKLLITQIESKVHLLKTKSPVRVVKLQSAMQAGSAA